MFKSQFCEVSYLQNINAVLCNWKKSCSNDDYRNPLKYGLELINEKNATTLGLQIQQMDLKVQMKTHNGWQQSLFQKL